MIEGVWGKIVLFERGRERGRVLVRQAMLALFRRFQTAKPRALHRATTIQYLSVWLNFVVIFA